MLGLTLLERAALACQAAGVTDCYVVVGYGKERLLPYITTVARRYRMRLHAVHNPCWQEGNGTSALAAEPYLSGPFLLLMCDHIFDPAILRRLIIVGRTSSTCLLAVDTRIDQIFDRDDATKVRLSGRAITAIGKDLTAFDAIDTGLFFCHPPLFGALQQARTAGDGSLSGGVRYLIATDQVLTVPIGDHYWVDVDTVESLAYAEQILLSSLMTPPDVFQA
jgi:1L-myo-inositol 1-phosphate cytidylyltransferase